MGANGDPLYGNGDPIKDNGDRIKGNGGPIKVNGDPIKDNGTPIKGSGDPIKDNGTPIKGSGDPFKDNGDRIKGNGDPINDVGTPIKGNGTPIKDNGGHIKGSGDPIKDNGDLIKGNGDPINDIGNPIKGNGTPIKDNGGHIKGSGDPIKDNGDLIKGNGDPIKDNGGHIKGSGDPINDNGGHIKGSGDPIKDNRGCIKGNGDPIKANGTPVKGNGPPIQVNGAGPLGPLRAALEAALLQAPGVPLPPELSPVLGVPLPPPAKCLRLDGAGLLRRNLGLDPAGGPPLGLSRLHTALSILEKYGRNLLQPRPPRHWRCVSYSNPVFSSTLGAIQGAREVLMLLGYTAEGGLGLSFPPEVPAPHGPRVAAVTADVLVLRRELELLLANQHPNPHFFTDILKEGHEEDLVTDAMPIVERDGAIGDPPSRCDRPRTPPSSSSPHVPPPAAMGQPHSPTGQEGGGWACASCTFLNPGPSVLCGVCERPRLARRPPPQGWSCPHCTYFNPGPGPTCALCRQHRGTPPPPPEPPLVPPKPPPVAPSPPPPPPPFDVDQWRQRRLDQDGRRVVALLRAAERSGSPLPLPPPPSPRALWALAGAGGLRGAQEPGGPLGALSLQEAARGWACAMGQAGRALQACVGHRRRQLRALASLGFPERLPSGRALFQAGGLLSPALAQLQAPRLRPFLQRLWEPRDPPMDFEQPNQHALVRRALAELGLASWGRAQLLVTLGRELGLGRAPQALPELVEAVGSCRDREELRRRLRCECAVCGTALPREQAQVLTGCQCWLCPECFRLHFTVGVRERRVRDLVCPACARPDLRDPSCAQGYFGTLDAGSHGAQWGSAPQLRQCLDPATYELFSQKLTELELERDPQFLWCPQCSFGFIFEAERGPAQCPQCKQCCCPRCQRPWHPVHASLSCAAFEAWLGSRDPQAAAPMGLEDFVQEHSVGCPRCGARFALARGGCLHLQCSQCQHQFCSGCACAFHPRNSCPIERCPLRGSLHGHHPRDCIFHLRDWSPPRLQRLLQDASVPFETEPPPGIPSPPGGGCMVLEQKETPMGLKDEPCGREAPKDYAGLCRGHYTEYLVRLINHHGLDPLPLYDSDELRAAAERHLAAGRTERLPGEGGVAYERRLRGLLRREAPLRGGAPAGGT
ncbi:E3 ubiquitin-protein ligase RNF31 [Ara ararauna]